MSEKEVVPENAGLVVVPADQVKPETIGVLSVRYDGDTPVLVVTDGIALPTRLAVVDAQGATVGAYAAVAPQTKAVPHAGSPTISHAIFVENKADATIWFLDSSGR
ncbi:hypothetical protein R1T08_14975 [Streptomyces sp. SBC-4]|nr:hypothetical protein [Streptomyces sp. SBC-4]MDV5145480.1 hypothetical protein [Streptomyces sp. SBC-4]